MSPTEVIDLLRPFTPEQLRRYPDPVYAIDTGGHLLYFNPAWARFAEDNGGEPAISDRWPLGSDVLSAIPQPLLPFYRDLFASAADARDPVRGPVTHTYECSSARLLRRFQMSIYALASGSGFLVVNASLVERPHDLAERPDSLPGDAYRDAHGVVSQCCHCRRTSNPAHPGRWDWVPAWVDRFPPGTSHTLCEPCFAFYYGPPLRKSR